MDTKIEHDDVVNDVQESQEDTEQDTQEQVSEQESTNEMDSEEEEQAVEESDSDEEDEDDAIGVDDDVVKKLVQKNRKVNRENQKLRERAFRSEYELEAMKAVVAVGLPIDMAKRLHGSNAEELRKDAEELVAIVGKRRRIPGALPDDGVRHKKIIDDDAETDLNKIGARIYER